MESAKEVRSTAKMANHAQATPVKRGNVLLRQSTQTARTTTSAPRTSARTASVSVHRTPAMMVILARRTPVKRKWVASTSTTGIHAVTAVSARKKTPATVELAKLASRRFATTPTFAPMIPAIQKRTVSTSRIVLIARTEILAPATSVPTPSVWVCPKLVALTARALLSVRAVSV